MCIQMTIEMLKNEQETDLEMSPRPLGTTIFEEIYIRIQVEQRQRPGPGLG